MKQIHKLCGTLLTLFGEAPGAAQGDTAVHTGVNATDAASQSGVQARDAAVQDRSRTFLELIMGEYKDLYDARVNETVRRRLGDAGRDAERYRALAPTLALLQDTLGLDPGDTDAIREQLNRIPKDAPAVQEEQPKPPEQGEQAGQGEKGEQEKKDEAGASHADEAVRHCYEQWEREASALAARYPSFELVRELADPTFCALLRAGVDMRTAFETVHRNEILPAVMAHTARTVRGALARSLLAGSARVPENGITPTAGIARKSDVSQLSRAERADIMRRVMSGEKITL